MCCIIKVSQKFLEKNYFACSKIILWNLYNWMYRGKLTFSTPSTHKKITQSVGGRKKISCKCILQEKIHGEINGLKKNHAYNKYLNPPPPHLPPAPLEVKWLAHDRTSFIEENPCSSILARRQHQKATT